MQKISIELTKSPKQKPQNENALGFGQFYTDHMFIMNYDEGQGWHNPRIVPYGPFSLDPAAMCLHYGQEVFEGLKAYRAENGKIFLFRPEKNIARLNVSNDRLCIPAVDEEFCVHAIKTLVELEKSWVPSAPGASLYIRPYIFAVDPHVGVHPAKHLIFAVILSPVGGYYKEGLKPIGILVETEYVRAARGGMGYVKTAGNYAASLKSQDKAEKLGFTQVLWLDAVERKYIEEVGTMNVFFVLDGEVVTPSLQGSILSGITRMSVIELLRSSGISVSERKISVDELFDAAKTGRLTEAFGSGTAAVISPIGSICKDNDNIIINHNQIGPLSQKLYDILTGIQWAKIADDFGWRVEVC